MNPGEFSPRGMIPIAANPNDITFSCGCSPVTRNLRYKTVYHRRTTDDDGNHGLPSVAVVIIVGIIIRVFCKLLWRGGLAQQPPRAVERQIMFARVPTNRARGAQCSSSTEIAQNSLASATTSSNEPGSDIEMMRPLRPPGGAANEPGDFPGEG